MWPWVIGMLVPGTASSSGVVRMRFSTVEFAGGLRLFDFIVDRHLGPGTMFHLFLFSFCCRFSENGVL